MIKRLIILAIFIVACAVVARVNGLGVTTQAKQLTPAPSYIQSSPHTEVIVQPAGHTQLLQPAVMP